MNITNIDQFSDSTRTEITDIEIEQQTVIYFHSEGVDSFIDLLEDLETTKWGTVYRMSIRTSPLVETIQIFPESTIELDRMQQELIEEDKKARINYYGYDAFEGDDFK